MNFMLFGRSGKAASWGIAALVAALAVLGCERSEPANDKRDQQGPQVAAAQDDAQHAQPTQADTATPRLVVSDDRPERPERIVSLAPNITEILFALGAGTRVVAVTRYCDYPPAASELPKVGGVVDTDLEAILSQRPDLVIGVTSGGDRDLAGRLANAGVTHAFLRMDNLPETYWGIEKVGELIGEAKKASGVVEEMKERVARLSRAGLDEPAADDDGESGQGPRVLMLYGRDPLVAAGPDTFGHELITLAGGQNVLSDAKTSYPKLDIEKVISLDPERIIDASEAASNPDDDFWAEYTAIEAVEAGQVHPLRDPVVLRPAPRLVEGLEKIRRAVAGRGVR